ncbi:MAG: DUF1080 domain-containing protein [Planctomycetota bacterium]|nr:DUF1080 domain-containing protein [Planctomycetota bacterium]MDA1163752.1 DUF1080 domain-containing protein [Planctomycetota bacterium]
MNVSRLVLIAFSMMLVSASSMADEEKAGEWVQLFNGKNLDGWIPKIRHHNSGENFGNTFRVKDGILQVGYDGYEKFDEQFGHLFYKESFSHYRLRVEYRFVGEQATGGPGWAFRNSGLMLHGQKAETMGVDQDFPASIEVQLLGGDGRKDRTTGNLCTPYTHVVMDGKLVKRHCTSAKSKTYHGDQWVTCEVEVLGNDVIRHLYEGQVVLEYNSPQLDDSSEVGKKLIAAQGGAMLSSGTISLQSESHPCEFRKVELLILKK